MEQSTLLSKFATENTYSLSIVFHMKHILTLCLAFFIHAISMQAQQVIDINLWPDGLPNSNGFDQQQPYNDGTQNFQPSIRVFLPAADKANGKAVVCCPGGGYSHLAMDHEGYDWAPFFNDLGFAFIVLKYRMPHAVTDVPISDAQEALRVVRSHAADWHINPCQVGIMGSSAGGHLASTIATHSDSLTAPAFQILFYPVITMNEQFTHRGSRHNLIGKDAAYDKVQLYSNELQVTAQTPPAILLLSDDDTTVPSPNSVNYYLALKQHHVRASLHIYPTGGHGWGSRSNFRYHEQMLSDLTAWLQQLK